MKPRSTTAEILRRRKREQVEKDNLRLEDFAAKQREYHHNLLYRALINTWEKKGRIGIKDIKAVFN